MSQSVAESVRVIGAGNSGSGKSYRAWHMYLSRMPRVILLDQTGEWIDRSDAEAQTVGEAVDAIRTLSKRSHKWTVCVQLDPGELGTLVQWMIPVPDVRKSPIRMVGGAVVLVDEVDLVAPAASAKEEVRTLYRRSRHVGLSVVSLTQRPANVSREVTAQSVQAFALHLSEPRDRDYMADLMRWNPQQVRQYYQWTRQHQQGLVWKDLRSGRTLFYPNQGQARSFPSAEQSDAFASVE